MADELKIYRIGDKFYYDQEHEGFYPTCRVMRRVHVQHFTKESGRAGRETSGRIEWQTRMCGRRVLSDNTIGICTHCYVGAEDTYSVFASAPPKVISIDAVDDVERGEQP